MKVKRKIFQVFCGKNVLIRNCTFRFRVLITKRTKKNIWIILCKVSIFYISFEHESSAIQTRQKCTETIQCDKYKIWRSEWFFYVYIFLTVKSIRWTLRNPREKNTKFGIVDEILRIAIVRNFYWSEVSRINDNSTHRITMSSMKKNSKPSKVARVAKYLKTKVSFY